MSADRIQEQQNSEASYPPNIIAWVGIIFGLVAAVLYGILFLMLRELPSSRNEFEELATNAPALTRLLIVGGSAGLLNTVSLILCLTGYLIPGRSKFEAVTGSIITGLMLLAVFSIVLVSLTMSP